MQDLCCITWGLSLWPVDSLVVVCRFSCSMACGSLVPQPGIEPISPTLQGEFLTTGPPGKFFYTLLYNALFLFVTKHVRIHCW